MTREDAISREWLKTAIHNFYYGLKHTPTEEDIQAYIDAAPSVSYSEKTNRCEDAVSRRDVLDGLASIAKAKARSDAQKAMMGRTMFFVEQLPPVSTEKTGRWIPVSEGLPKSAGVYIVTREFTDGFEYADLTDACYFDGTSTWHNDNRINHGREYVDKKIKAWMPLPEPYEPQESEVQE